MNLGFGGGGIESEGPALSINKTTVSGNRGGAGNGVGITSTSLIKFQNSIVANNAGGNCSGTITSNGYNLSSDGSCNGPGDMNDTNLLGPLQYNSEPTKTQCRKSGD